MGLRVRVWGKRVGGLTFVPEGETSPFDLLQAAATAKDAPKVPATAGAEDGDDEKSPTDQDGAAGVAGSEPGEADIDHEVEEPALSIQASLEAAKPKSAIGRRPGQESSYLTNDPQGDGGGGDDDDGNGGGGDGGMGRTGDPGPIESLTKKDQVFWDGVPVNGEAGQATIKARSQASLTAKVLEMVSGIESPPPGRYPKVQYCKVLHFIIQYSTMH